MFRAVRVAVSAPQAHASNAPRSAKTLSLTANGRMQVMNLKTMLKVRYKAPKILPLRTTSVQCRWAQQHRSTRQQFTIEGLRACAILFELTAGTWQIFAARIDGWKGKNDGSIYYIRVTWAGDTSLGLSRTLQSDSASFRGLQGKCNRNIVLGCSHASNRLLFSSYWRFPLCSLLFFPRSSRAAKPATGLQDTFLVLPSCASE